MNKIQLIPDSPHGDLLYKVYYHFLFGALLPFANFISECTRLGIKKDNNSRFFIGPFGEFNNHMTDLSRKLNVNIELNKITNADKYYQLRTMEMYNFKDGIPCFNWEPLTCDSFLNTINMVKDVFLKKSERKNISILRDDERWIYNCLLMDNCDKMLTLTSDVTLNEQINLFANAKSVTACHGSGLANIIWMEPGSTVREYIPSEFKNTKSDYYEILSKAMGLKYERIN